MVFGKLFKKNKLPKNSGNEEMEGDYVLETKYYLNGKSIKGKPLYELTSEHIIGSEEGDIIIEDKNVSSKHLQVNLAEGVVTIMDLSSELGTKVNKKEIEPGKKVILQDGDDVRLGKLKLIFEEVEEEVPAMTPEQNEPELSEAETGLSPEDDTGEIDTSELTADTAPAEEAPVEAPAEFPKEAPSAPESTGELSLDDAAKEQMEEIPEDLSEEEEAPKEAGLNVDTSIIKNGPAEEEDDKKEKTFKLQLYNYTEEDPDFVSEKEQKKKNLKPINLRKLKKNDKLKSKGSVVTPSANAFVRFIGLVTDLVLFTFIIFFLPQKDLILKYIDQGITKGLALLIPLFKKYALKYVDIAYTKVPALAKIQEEVIKHYKDEYYIYIQYILFFMLLQMIMTLLFGVTIGQFLFGMKAKGNFVLKRLLGPIRVFLNYLFLPFFWLFELPTVFSKRSFKEVLSFTQVEFVSKVRLFLSLFVLYPLLGLGIIVAPLFEDMTIPKGINLELAKEIKTVKNEVQYNHHSDALNLSLISNENMIYLPYIKVVQVDGKKIIQIGYRAIIKSEGVVASYELIKDKKINFKKFFDHYTKFNPYVYMNQKTILSVVHDASNDNPNFKSKNFPMVEFAKEVEQVLEGALTFSIEDPNQAKEFLIKHGPFFIGHMDVRRKILALVDSPVSKIKIQQIGSSLAMTVYSEAGKKKYLSVLPLNNFKSYVYKIRYEEEKDLEQIFKLDLNKEDTNQPNDISSNFLNLITDNKREQVDEKLQDLIEYFNNFASLCILEGDEKSLAVLQKSIRDILELLESNKETVKFKDAKANKLKQNLNDLLQAIIDKDTKFFNIKKTKTV